MDESPRLQSRFGVQSIPTLLLLDGGQVKATQIGAPPPPALRSWLEQGLARSQPRAPDPPRVRRPVALAAS